MPPLSFLCRSASCFLPTTRPGKLRCRSSRYRSHRQTSGWLNRHCSWRKCLERLSSCKESARPDCTRCSSRRKIPPCLHTDPQACARAGVKLCTRETKRAGSIGKDAKRTHATTIVLQYSVSRGRVEKGWRERKGITSSVDRSSTVVQ